MKISKVFLIILCISVLGLSSCQKKTEEIAAEVSVNKAAAENSSKSFEVDSNRILEGEKILVSFKPKHDDDRKFIIRPRCDNVTFHLKCAGSGYNESEKKTVTLQPIGIGCPDPNDPYVDVIIALEGIPLSAECDLSERFTPPSGVICKVTAEFDTKDIFNPTIDFKSDDPKDFCFEKIEEGVFQVPLEKVKLHAWAYTMIPKE